VAPGKGGGGLGHFSIPPRSVHHFVICYNDFIITVKYMKIYKVLYYYRRGRYSHRDCGYKTPEVCPYQCIEITFAELLYFYVVNY